MRKAFVFTCEECGRDNYVPTYTRVMSEDEIEDVRQQIASSEEYEGMNIIICPEQSVSPATVECVYCHAVFTARYPLFDQFKD